jgi:hypothetical protein
MQTTLSIHVPGVTESLHDQTKSGPENFDFELDSTDLVFIPNVGDEVELPGMLQPVEITSRSFKYSNPSKLQVWLNYDLEAESRSLRG